MHRAASSLTDLGFTELESRAYVALLESGPVTGYRVAQLVGKAAANTYKALESLTRRGAIVCDQGPTALYRAVAPGVLTQTMADAYTARSRRVAEALAHIGEPQSDQRVYRIESADHAYARCAEMVQGARRSAYVDAFPAALERIRPLLGGAVKRGVTVAVKAYAPTELAGATSAIPAQAAVTLARWPGEWLNVVVDAGTTLLAFFERGGDVLRQAVWTDSPYISLVYQSALAGEIGMAYVQQHLAGVPLSARVRETLRVASALADAETFQPAPAPRPQTTRSRRR